MSEQLTRFTAYITKYCLSTGTILEMEVEQSSDYPSMVIDLRPRVLQNYHAGDWHILRSDAVKRCREMQEKKIRALKRQLAKLEKMRFE